MVGRVGEVGDTSVGLGPDPVDEAGAERLQAVDLGVELVDTATQIKVDPSRDEEVKTLLVVGALQPEASVQRRVGQHQPPAVVLILRDDEIQRCTPERGQRAGLGAVQCDEIERRAHDDQRR